MNNPIVPIDKIQDCPSFFSGYIDRMFGQTPKQKQSLFLQVRDAMIDGVTKEELYDAAIDCDTAGDFYNFLRGRINKNRTHKRNSAKIESMEIRLAMNRWGIQ